MSNLFIIPSVLGVATKSGLEKPVNIFNVTRKSKPSMPCALLLLQVLFLLLWSAVTSWAWSCTRALCNPVRGERPAGAVLTRGAVCWSFSSRNGWGPSDVAHRADWWHNSRTVWLLFCLLYGITISILRSSWVQNLFSPIPTFRPANSHWHCTSWSTH